MSVAYVDTHVIVWLYSGQLARLSTNARTAIDESDLLVSPAVLLELEYLKEIGRIQPHAGRIVDTLSRQLGLTVCDLPFVEVVEAALGEKWVRDPFDRLIVGHAKATGAPLITKDEAIRVHYRHAVW